MTREENKTNRVSHDEPDRPFDPMLTGEASRALNVSPEMVRHLVRMGRLRAIRTARGTRIYSRTDVMRLAQERAKQ